MLYFLLLGIAIVNVLLASFFVVVLYWLAILINGLGGFELLLMYHLTPNIVFSVCFVLFTIISTNILGKKIMREYPEQENIFKKIFFIVLILGFSIYFLYDKGIIHWPKRGAEFIDEKKENILEEGKTVVFEGSSGWNFPTKEDQVLFTIHNTVGGTNVWDSYLLSLDKNSKQYDLKQISDLRKGHSIHVQDFDLNNTIFYVVENQDNSAYSLYSYDLLKNSTSNIDKVSNWEENKRILDKYNSSIVKGDCNYKKDSLDYTLMACLHNFGAIKPNNNWSLYDLSNNTLVYQSKEEKEFNSYDTAVITDDYFYYSIDGDKIIRVNLETKEETIIVEDNNIQDFAITDNFVVYKNGIGNSWEYKGQLVVVKLK